MKLTFRTDMGELYMLEIDSQMKLEDMMALLEAESGIPVNEQSISFRGRDMNRPKSTMAELVPNEALLLLRRKVTVGGRNVERDSEMMRLELLGNPALMRQLRQELPELAEAAENSSERFAEILRQTRQLELQHDVQRRRELERLNADPFDVEAQGRIEEAIRQQGVLDNLEHALEHFPESFGRVTMLYIPVEVNGIPIKAFVDSGAQQTIMSPECAEKCGIMRLLDRRFAGVARGVGTAQIFGRVHSAQLKLADLYLACAFTIMEGREVDLLFGLDMLKAHQACIDLSKNVLRIRGREVKFLAEHELPEKARTHEMPTADELASITGVGASGSQLVGSPADSRPLTRTPASQPFPGAGQTLVGAPRLTPSTQPHSNSHPEESVKLLINFGVSRQEAIRLLDLAGGNVDVAASMLFGN